MVVMRNDWFQWILVIVTVGLGVYSFVMATRYSHSSHAGHAGHKRSDRMHSHDCC